MTQKLIKKHIDEGTLFILLLAVDSKNPNNVIEKADRSLSFYEDMIKNFLEEGNEFRKKINASYGVEQRDLLKKLKSNPYRGYFCKNPLLKVSFDLEKLSQEELLALYQFCLLEEQVRESGIIYNSGTEFYAALFPKRGFSLKRQSDCNGIAGYYCSLISFSGSRLLEKSAKFASLEGHAELVFANGTLSFVKNTSNVEEDESDPDKLFNFYDPEFDFQLYGASSKSLRGIDETVYSEITEIVTSGEEIVCKIGAEEAKKKLKLLEKSFELSQGSPTAMSNYIDFVFRLKELKEIESDEASRMIEKVLAKYIDLTYFAAFDVYNFVKTFGYKRGKAILDLYEESILRSQDRFIDFVLAPIKAMKALPGFDRKKDTSPNSFSLGVENRMRLLNLLYAISGSFSACFLYKKLYGALEKEKKTWKK